MAVQKTTGGLAGSAVYAVIDPHGNQTMVKQGQASFVGGVPTITVTVGGATIGLTKQNMIDLLPAFTGFSTSGTLS